MEMRRLVMDSSAPFCTSKEWAVADGETGEVLFGRGENERREIASLTKIMTCYTSLMIAERFEVNLELTTTRIKSKWCRVQGTRARIRKEDSLSIWDLLHGLMLPSGNDAALALADYFGEYLRLVSLPTDPDDLSPTAIKCFITEMNKNAELIGMTRTMYCNPHGLKHIFNRSTVTDLALLSAHAMKLPHFHSLVNCKKWSALATNEEGVQRTLNWTNTNRLLWWKHYGGIKTGITPSAGPCLAATFNKNGVSLIIIILNCKTMDTRWMVEFNIII